MMSHEFGVSSASICDGAAACVKSV